MEKRRETDGSSSPSVERRSKTSFNLSTSNDLPRDNNLRAHQPDHSTGKTEQTREARREENPFSFKHFLKKDSRPNYNLSGARPKVYSPARTSPSEETTGDAEGIYPCNPTELPDFVQDHLVIEQCYLNHQNPPSSASLVADIDNLPDFTINNAERRQASSRNERIGEASESDVSRDLPFDLTGGLERRNHRDRSEAGASSVARNDLPSYPRPNRLPVRQNERLRFVQAFPFDLPSSTVNDSSDPARGPSNSPTDEAGVAKSLPDFLNYGPIRNRVSSGETESSLDMPEASDASHLPLENERLRVQLKIARLHLDDKMRMIESLKSELAARRAVDRDETKHLEKAMEQVEANLQKSTKRATSAESAVALLKHEVKALTAEVSILRSENRELRSVAGAGCSDYRLPGTEKRIKKLSDELRAAATSAEASLRQLMSGVDNLKVMASALENVDRIEDRTKDFSPDSEEENAAGPAL